MKRVGIISISHESNTFVPGRTTLADFRAIRLLFGDAAKKQKDWGNHELAGFVAGLEKEGIEPVVLLAAGATPGGVIEAEAFNFLVGHALAELANAGPLDGLLLAPHGAGVAENARDMDGFWLDAVRKAAGHAMPIIATLDPHANVSPAMVAATNALITYRTNPHLDQRDRGLEAAALMARTVRGEVKPVQAAVLPPVVMNIERQHTIESPARDLQNKAREIAARPGVLSASIILGFPYADVPEMGCGAIVVADGDQSAADAAAKELGQFVLDRREQLKGQLVSPADAMARAATMDKPVCLLDMGDNVGGGSPGDGTTLARLLDAAGKKAFVCLHDPAAVKLAAVEGIGGQLELDMGGHSGDLYGPPIRSRVTVRAITDGKFTDLRPRHGGTTHYDIGPTAIVDLPSGLTVMLTTRRAFPVSIVQLTAAGVDPTKYEFIVAKGVHAPVTAYAEACKSFLRINTPGMTSADVTAFKYEHRRQPMFPFEAVDSSATPFLHRGFRD